MTSVMAPYRNAGFFALRTPLLPYRFFFDLSDGVCVKESYSETELDDTLQRERARIVANLSHALESPVVREALFVASPSLDEAIVQWKRGELEADGERKVIHALCRYLGRMSTRSTPFGLFAGSSIGRLTKNTSLALAPRAANQRYTALDNSYVFLLLREINADAAYRASATYYPNNSIYGAAGKLRYAEISVDPSSSSMSYQLAALDRDEYLDFTLDQARNGATVSQLVELLVTTHAVAREEAAAFVDLLIDQQILVSELRPAVTGLDPLEDARVELERHPELASVLLAVEGRLRHIDRFGLGATRRAYEDVVTELRRLPLEDIEPSRLFRVDLWKPLVSDEVGREVVADIRAAITQIYRIAPRPPRTELDDLADAFYARYGDDAVPLGMALDPEFGIALGNSTIESESTTVLEGLTFEEPDPDEEAAHGALTEREHFLLRKLRCIWGRAQREWVLDEDDLRALEVVDKPPLPDSFAAWFQLARKPGGRGEGHELLFSAAVGPPAARLLGRFAHGRPQLSGLLRELARREAHGEPDAVFAEIAHLPEGRSGNVVCRPVLREFEIPYLGKSGAARDQQIPIGDLWVSVRDGRFSLWSRRLGRRVVPRLSCAHNITNNTVALYRFLSRLQSQGCYPWLSWNWGPFAHAPHLPRVRIGAVIVARETWTIDRRDLSRLHEVSAGGRYRRMLALRTGHGLPRFVALADGDNELAVDLENIVGIETLIDLVKSRPRARLMELWPGPDDAGVGGEEGRYVNEIVVPFLRRADDRRPQASQSCSWSAPQVFAPGSEWLHLELVTSKSAADEVLVRALADEIDGLKTDGICDLWFFTPTQTRDWTLKLYFHGEPNRLEAIALPRIAHALRALVSDGPLSSWSMGTYVQQTERYGGEGALPAAHALFFRDSEATLALIATLMRAGDDDLRWQLALMSVDRLLGDLCVELPERSAIVGSLRSKLVRSLPVGEEIEGQLSRKYRAHRGLVEVLLGPSELEVLADAERIFAERSRGVRSISADLRMLRVRGRLTRPWPELVAAFVQAAAHRLLRAATPAHELVIYDFLDRAYRSAVGRSKALAGANSQPERSGSP